MRCTLGKMRHFLSTILLQQHFSNISCHKRIKFITFKSHEKTKTKTKQKTKPKKHVLRVGGLSKIDHLVRIVCLFFFFFLFLNIFILSRRKNDYPKKMQNLNQKKKKKNPKKLTFFEETVLKKIFSVIFTNFQPNFL